MPKAENIINMKLPRVNPEKASNPVFLKMEGKEHLKNHELWFK